MGIQVPSTALGPSHAGALSGWSALPRPMSTPDAERHSLLGPNKDTCSTWYSASLDWMLLNDGNLSITLADVTEKRAASLRR